MDDIYKKYNLEDFLADDKFVDWVIKDANGATWTSWLKNNEDIRPMIQEAKGIIHGLQFKRDDPTQNIKDRIWKRIEDDTQAKEVSMPNRRRWIAMAIAASIAILALVLINQPDNSFTTDIAEHKEVTLPANSLVQLEPSSSLDYEESNWDKARNLDLQGQAHFEVSKGVPFTVHTAFGQVQVLGTEFDVLAEDGSFLVKVDEGKVKVSSDKHEHILTADMAYYKNPKNIDHDFIKKWQSDQMIIAFERQRLGDVISSLGLVTDKKIEAGSLDIEQLYTGKYDSGESLEDVLKQVFWPLQIQYEIMDDRVELK